MQRSKTDWLTYIGVFTFTFFFISNIRKKCDIYLRPLTFIEEVSLFYKLQVVYLFVFYYFVLFYQMFNCSKSILPFLKIIFSISSLCNTETNIWL